MVELLKFTDPIKRDDLCAVLISPSEFSTQPIGMSADLTAIRAKCEELKARTNGSLNYPQWDRELVEIVHHVLKDIPKRVASDMSFWHWICISQFRDIVWYRWRGEVAGEEALDNLVESMIGDADREHFLGANSLRGISRNTFARLWWCGHTSYSPEGGYSLSKRFFANQDRFNSIFERELGLSTLIARGCIDALEDVSEDQSRFVVRILNHYFTTLAAEDISEEQLSQLITDIKEYPAYKQLK